MGQKENPNGFRLGIIRNWDSAWYADSKYAEFLFEDFQIRAFLRAELNKAGVSHIQINRNTSMVKVDVYLARPGFVSNKSSIDISLLQEELCNRFKKVIKIIVLEEKTPDLSARLVSEWVCAQLEKRIAFRRAMKMAVQRSLKMGAKGVKVRCAGRLGGAEIARVEWYREGKIPLHTFRADIDYSFSEALTTYGKIGVQVWIYKGEILDTKKHFQHQMAILNQAE